MSQFKKYKRTNIAEMRPVTNNEILDNGDALLNEGVSISQADLETGSPKIGDMIARNPNNHNDQWLVAKEYFESNFKEIPGQDKLIG
jgi:hypothetical protein